MVGPNPSRLTEADKQKEWPPAVSIILSGGTLYRQRPVPEPCPQPPSASIISDHFPEAFTPAGPTFAELIHDFSYQRQQVRAPRGVDGGQLALRPVLLQVFLQFLQVVLALSFSEDSHLGKPHEFGNHVDGVLYLFRAYQAAFVIHMRQQ